jgi:predicted anti-sigma-YlaC factor YlaD
MIRKINPLWPAFLLLVVLSGGCSIKKFAVNQVGDAIASGGSVYESDDDIEFVGEALPFSLKLLESLLEVSPEHRGMLQTACQGYATYSYVYIQHQADLAADEDFRRSIEIRARARRMYERARHYGLRGLERSHPGITARLESDPAAAVAVVKKKKDVPMLYWNAVALGLAISVSKNDAAMLARIPEVEALVTRAIELDETWERGSLYEMNIILAGATPEVPDYDRLERDFERALELSEGRRAGLYVAYAETFALTRQDREEFRSLLEMALAIDPDEHVEVRLANLVAQRRARWLLERIDDLILEEIEPEEETT